MVTLRCTCGETFQADEAHIGKAIRCRCGRILEITAVPVLAPASVPRPPSRTQQAHETRAAGTSAAQRRGGWRVPVAVPATLLLVVLLVLWANTGVQPKPQEPDPYLEAANEALRERDPYVETTSPLSSPVGTAVRHDVDPLEALSGVRRARSLAARDDPRCASENLVRPRSSDELGSSYRGGFGDLRIVNGTDVDAVAVLIEAVPALPRRAIYIRASEIGRITQIPAGVYRLQFQLGSSWPRGGSAFCQVRGTSEFDRPLRFEEREADDAVEYSTFKVTLHPVPEGTATTHSIPASAFQLPPPP